MRIAFATFTEMPEGRPDDAQVGALVGAEYRVWNDLSVDWSAYDRVVIRSAWDYSHRVEEFLDWARRVGPERLRNVPELVAWNSDKLYLADIGVPIVPTAFVGPGDPLPLLDGEVVVKPNVSAGARNTGRFPVGRHAEAVDLIDRIRGLGRTALVQPYLESVDVRGETAIVFLGGERSHVLRKRPVLRAAGIAPLSEGRAGVAAVMLEDDLVVAGEATAVELRLADAVIAMITARFGVPLYARVDMVHGADGSPVVMELEMIEPCLYLETAPGSVERFAEAIIAAEPTQRR